MGFVAQMISRDSQSEFSMEAEDHQQLRSLPNGHCIGASLSQRMAPFDEIQTIYNLVKRRAEVETLPLAQAEDLVVICFGPLPSAASAIYLLVY